MNEIIRKRKYSGQGRLIVAISLILLGFVLLASNTGWISKGIKSLLISWQMLLIVIGLVKMIRGNFAGGFLVFVFGLFFFAFHAHKIYPNVIPNISTDFLYTYWPILLIAVGALLVLGWLFPASPNEKQDDTTANKGYVESHQVFESAEYVLDTVFKGGEIKSVFGKTLLDLRSTHMEESEIVLEVQLVFASVEILVPSSWNVIVSVDAVLGGFEDNRTHFNERVNTSPTLNIKGSCVLSNGTLKN